MSDAGPAPAKPLTAEYTIHSSSLGDEHAPTKNDRKIAFEVTGQAAKGIFDPWRSQEPTATQGLMDGVGL